MRVIEKQRALFGGGTLLLAILSLAGFSGCSQSVGETAVVASTSTSAATSKPAPIGLVDLDDRPVDLNNSSKDRVHVAVFIRSDCPISNRMAPAVRELYKNFQPKGVDFYLVYVDPRETVQAIRNHLKDFEYPCTPLRDPNHVLAEQTKATVTPEAVVFDGKGAITYRGRINDMYEDFGKSREVPTKQDLRDAITATLADKPVAEPETKAIGCYIGDLK